MLLRDAISSLRRVAERHNVPAVILIEVPPTSIIRWTAQTLALTHFCDRAPSTGATLELVPFSPRKREPVQWSLHQLARRATFAACREGLNARRARLLQAMLGRPHER